MRRWILAAMLMAGSWTPASAAIQTFQFTTIITSEFFNSEDTTGQGLSLIRAGDVLRGRFTFDDLFVGSAFGNNIFYINPIPDSRLTVSRGGVVVLTLTQRPVFFANGNQADYSQVGLTNGDPLGRRDAAFISIGGGDLDSGSVVGLLPDDPNVQFIFWSLLLRERCSAGSIETGDCVSNSPTLDFYQGGAGPLDLQYLFETRGVSEFNIGFQYADSNVAEAIGSLDAIGRVPEPGVWAMLVIGFGACGVAARRKSMRTKSLA